ncbi:hypothetical protein FA15DRAFT_68074 [Coprinopsis marcescibilis]|uniref:F-box domain-containing protein n=1 Tax=Coprinopsis marcescibilis TaxID=230819 RepID=A0A5C3KMW4_COPMA|nr:hypothetical protein FA15DRAFT_68074 [Coprinopsis marcescibilis]
MTQSAEDCCDTVEVPPAVMAATMEQMPTDIVYNILECIAREERPFLRTTALLSRHFRVLSQRLLFRKLRIPIRFTVNSISLAKPIPTSEEILGYIKEITIDLEFGHRDESSDTPDEGLDEVINALETLKLDEIQSLTLKSETSTTGVWNTLPKRLSELLVRVCGNTALHTVEFSSAPIHFIPHCRESLKQLTVKDPACLELKVPDATVRTVTSPIHLKSLTIEAGTVIPSQIIKELTDPQNCIDVQQLEYLKVATDPQAFPAIRGLLNYAQSLETFEIYLPGMRFHSWENDFSQRISLLRPQILPLTL